MLRVKGKKKSFLYIISGKLKGRKIFFYENEALKPTKNKVRETLFNWLGPILINSYIIDLFSGSGILGFECFSRGAKSVIMLEIDNIRYMNILENKYLFNIDSGIEVINGDSYIWIIKNNLFKNSIILLDPPFKISFLIKCFLIVEQIFLNKKIILYIEFNTDSILNFLPLTWIVLRKGKSNNVFFYLIAKIK